MLIISHPDDIHRFLTGLQGSYKRSQRDLVGAASICSLLFGGGLVLLYTAFSSIGVDTIEGVIFLFILALSTFMFPVWLCYGLAQQRYTFEATHITVWSGARKLWSVNIAGIKQVMYSNDMNGNKELAFYSQQGKTRKLNCTKALEERIESVFAHWEDLL